MICFLYWYTGWFFLLWVGLYLGKYKFFLESYLYIPFYIFSCFDIFYPPSLFDFQLATCNLNSRWIYYYKKIHSLIFKSDDYYQSNKHLNLIHKGVEKYYCTSLSISITNFYSLLTLWLLQYFSTQRRHKFECLLLIG